MQRHRPDTVSLAFGLIFAFVVLLSVTGSLDSGGEIVGWLVPGVLAIAAVALAVGALVPDARASALRAVGLEALGHQASPSTAGAGDDLVDPWRRYVVHAEQARQRFAQTVAATPPGPMRERLDSVGHRIDTGVDDVRRVATRGHALARASAQLDPATTLVELAQTEAELAGSPTSRHLQAEVESLQAQLASAERMAATVDEAGQQLRLLGVRLNEAVARAIELSVGIVDEASLRGLDRDVADIVDELESLRLAVEDTQHANRPPRGELAIGDARPEREAPG